MKKCYLPKKKKSTVPADYFEVHSEVSQSSFLIGWHHYCHLYDTKKIRKYIHKESAVCTKMSPAGVVTSVATGHKWAEFEH